MEILDCPLNVLVPSLFSVTRHISTKERTEYGKGYNNINA